MCLQGWGRFFPFSVPSICTVTGSYCRVHTPDVLSAVLRRLRFPSISRSLKHAAAGFSCVPPGGLHFSLTVFSHDGLGLIPACETEIWRSVAGQFSAAAGAAARTATATAEKAGARAERKRTAGPPVIIDAWVFAWTAPELADEYLPPSRISSFLFGSFRPGVSTRGGDFYVRGGGVRTCLFRVPPAGAGWREAPERGTIAQIVCFWTRPAGAGVFPACVSGAAVGQFPLRAVRRVLAARLLRGPGRRGGTREPVDILTTYRAAGFAGVPWCGNWCAFNRNPEPTGHALRRSDINLSLPDVSNRREWGSFVGMSDRLLVWEDENGSLCPSCPIGWSLCSSGGGRTRFGCPGACCR